MRALASLALASSLLLTSQAQLIPFFASSSDDASIMADDQQAPAAQQQQQPLHAPNNQQPPTPIGPSASTPSEPSGSVILSDVISTQRSISIFAGYTRDIASVAQRLDTSALNTTVLAPLNTAVAALPRKPWEDAREYAELGADAYSGDDEGIGRAHANLRRFTLAHVVPAAPWKEGERVESMGGGTVWWETRGDKALVMPGEIEIERIASRVANGEVWIIKGVINYAS